MLALIHAEVGEDTRRSLRSFAVEMMPPGPMKISSPWPAHAQRRTRPRGVMLPALPQSANSFGEKTANLL
jgi:hypothetical protein